MSEDTTNEILSFVREITRDSAAGTPVNFSYMSRESIQNNESAFDTVFTSRCRFIPKQGDVVIDSKGKHSVVKEVVHSFLKFGPIDQESHIQTVQVLLSDPDD